MSRVEDYFETDKDIDAKRVAIHGVSRLGKTVMWAGAHDQRFAAVIASCSRRGRRGAQPSQLRRDDCAPDCADAVSVPVRRELCEVCRLPGQGAHGRQSADRADCAAARCCCRPATPINWSDPKGEFLAAVAAGPVYKLLGKQDLGTDVWPAAKAPILHDLNYYMHDGGHGMVPTDWDYLRAIPERTSAPGAMMKAASGNRCICAFCLELPAACAQGAAG